MINGNGQEIKIKWNLMRWIIGSIFALGTIWAGITKIPALEKQCVDNEIEIVELRSDIKHIKETVDKIDKRIEYIRYGRIDLK